MSGHVHTSLCDHERGAPELRSPRIYRATVGFEYQNVPGGDVFALRHHVQLDSDNVLDSKLAFLDAIAGLAWCMDQLEIRRLENLGQLKKIPCDTCDGKRAVEFPAPIEKGVDGGFDRIPNYNLVGSCSRCYGTGKILVHENGAMAVLEKIRSALGA